MIEATEDSEKVRRRGRWLNARTMEIYLQELGSAQLLASLEPQVRSRIEVLAEGAPGLCSQAHIWLQAGVPSFRWPCLWQQPCL